MQAGSPASSVVRRTQQLDSASQAEPGESASQLDLAATAEPSDSASQAASQATDAAKSQAGSEAELEISQPGSAGGAGIEVPGGHEHKVVDSSSGYQSAGEQGGSPSKKSRQGGMIQKALGNLFGS